MTKLKLKSESMQELRNKIGGIRLSHDKNDRDKE